MAEQHCPTVADPFVKADLAVRRVGGEIRRGVVDTEAHFFLLPSNLFFFGHLCSSSFISRGLGLLSACLLRGRGLVGLGLRRGRRLVRGVPFSRSSFIGRGLGLLSARLLRGGGTAQIALAAAQSPGG